MEAEITAIEKIVCYTQFPRQDKPRHAGPQGEAPGNRI